MKTLYWLLALWITATVITGIVGDALLMRNWRSTMEASFQHDVVACRAILKSTEWSLPLEANAAWGEMERLLDLEVIPNRKPTGNLQATDPVMSQVHWSHTGTDGPRLSTRVDTLVRLNTAEPATIATGPAERQEYWFRLTRSLPVANTRSTWWKLWLSCNFFGLLFGLAIIRRQRKQSLAEKSLLAPWLTATRNAGEIRENVKAAALPPILEVSSPLEPPLSLIAERVNNFAANLQNANERSELVLGNLQEGVLAVDEHSRVLLANNALTRLLELNEEHYLYRPLLEVVRIPVVAQLIESVLREQVQREVTVELGSEARSLRLIVRPLPLGGGRQGVLLTARDETMLKRIESVRRDFVANASHELKTPLAAIRAYAETLQMGALDDRIAAEQFVNNIITQADRINGLVQGMLQLSRVQAGTALRIEAFHIGEALQACISAAEAMAKNKGVCIRVSIEPELTVLSDRDGFQTIASNLLSNAVRYTPADGTVSIAAQRDGNWLQLSVTDTGIGIHPQDLERIFERFYRAEKDRSVDTGGTGLGLSIVKHLVQALDGEVSAESQPNIGSRFDVRLPLGNQQ